MSRFDLRTEQGRENDFSFYVYSDLLAQKHGTENNIFFFDTLDEAISKYREFPKNMLTALGIDNGNQRKEGEPTIVKDLIQRKGGEDVLIKDFLAAENTVTDPRVHAIALELCEKLKVEWELDHMLRNSILIPREYGTAPEQGTCVHSSYSDNKRLDYLERDRDIGAYVPRAEGPLFAVGEAYILGEGSNVGWMGRNAFFHMIMESDGGYLKENRPKVQSFYVHYIDDRGNFGAGDISPHTLRELLDREKYMQPIQEFRSEADPCVIWEMKDGPELDALSRSIAKFARAFNAYTHQKDMKSDEANARSCSEYQLPDAQQIKAAILQGNVSGLRTDLRNIADNDSLGPWTMISRELLSKLDAARPEKAQSLERLLANAEKHKGQEIAPVKNLERGDR